MLPFPLVTRPRHKWTVDELVVVWVQWYTKWSELQQASPDKVLMVSIEALMDNPVSPRARVLPSVSSSALRERAGARGCTCRAGTKPGVCKLSRLATLAGTGAVSAFR